MVLYYHQSYRILVPFLCELRNFICSKFSFCVISIKKCLFLASPYYSVKLIFSTSKVAFVNMLSSEVKISHCRWIFEQCK